MKPRYRGCPQGNGCNERASRLVTVVAAAMIGRRAALLDSIESPTLSERETNSMRAAQLLGLLRTRSDNGLRAQQSSRNDITFTRSNADLSCYIKGHQSC